MNKAYYLCVFHQESPLGIMSGKSEESDLDVLLDPKGVPYIPGSSLTGILRDMAGQDPAAPSLFGYVRKKTEKEEAESRESRLIVSDALLPANADRNEIHVTIRDAVAINDEGAAKDESKFDFQVVETSQPYTAILELTYESEKEAEYRLLKNLMETIAAGGIRSGHKTTRGYGKLSCTVHLREFDLGSEADPKPEQVKSWLTFHPWEEDAFGGAKKIEGEPAAGNGLVIHAGLRMKGSFLVQVSSSDVNEVDAKPLEGHMKPNSGQPTIPGTSWAGVFRHRMKELCGQFPELKIQASDVDGLFGIGKDGKAAAKSAIRFSETPVRGGKALNVTRIALDRYTMSPRASALFSTQVWQGGNAELEITVNREIPDNLRGLLEAALLDLHCGLLTFGHSAGIGYGHAEITDLRINGQQQDQLLGYTLTEVKPDA